MKLHIGGLVCLIGLAGCSAAPETVVESGVADQGDVEQREALSLDAELLRNFTLEQLADLSDAVQKENADLDLHSPEFRAVFFARVAEVQTEKAEAAGEGRLQSYYLPGVGVTLTNDEAYLLAANPWNIGPTQGAADQAALWAQSWYPGSQYQTQADAFRHAFWNILMAKRIGVTWARDYATAHESTSSGIDRAMDMNNNSVGRIIYNASPTSTEHTLGSNAYWYPKKLVTRVAQITTASLVHLR